MPTMTEVVSQLFDSHCHLDRLAPEATAGAALSAARRAGVGGWLLPGVRRRHWPDLLAIAAADAAVRAAPGLHPMMAAQWDDSAATELTGLLRKPECAAVGEIGLDGMIDVPRRLQEKAFYEQLQLAVAAGKPVLIHCRRAWGEVLAILRRERAERVGGILHGFGGSPQIAREAVDLGFVIAFGGPLTWPNARKRVEVLRALPEDAIVLESDAPDLPPHPHRGEPNRPEWLPLIAAKVAEIRGWDSEETARITTENTRRILRRQLQPGNEPWK
ncbi:TatD family deoxyribonuclease [Geothermobacter hydrogeniphilus]|uniref:TatD family deoxyribonuclease n=2 Tax=Geothermobacter hydrogeniphilus TaxID=1969733 RepID=A0A2K2H719_9BACT|nr:TatD family deoxyribonuclease [Geothermobacter hydrogeniphilus]